MKSLETAGRLNGVPLNSFGVCLWMIRPGEGVRVTDCDSPTAPHAWSVLRLGVLGEAIDSSRPTAVMASPCTRRRAQAYHAARYVPFHSDVLDHDCAALRSGRVHLRSTALRSSALPALTRYAARASLRDCASHERQCGAPAARCDAPAARS